MRFQSTNIRSIYVPFVSDVSVSYVKTAEQKYQFHFQCIEPTADDSELIFHQPFLVILVGMPFAGSNIDVEIVSYLDLLMNVKLNLKDLTQHKLINKLTRRCLMYSYIQTKYGRWPIIWTIFSQNEWVCETNWPRGVGQILCVPPQSANESLSGMYFFNYSYRF